MTADTADIYANIRNKALEEAAMVCDEYAEETKERGMEERGYLTYEIEATLNSQNELARAIRALKTPE